MDDRYKANGARLSRLLIDKGTEAMRNVLDSIHPPATLTATLNSHYGFLQRLRVINCSQMDILFPPTPLAPSTSEDYDITLLFILLRNICGLHPPASTGSWDTKPPPTDQSREADLARIKYYRNVIYGHITTTGVDDVNFQSYWNDLSAALTRRGVNIGEIGVIKTAPLEVNVYLQQIKEWKEKEDQIEVLLKKIMQYVEKKIKAAVRFSACAGFLIIIFVIVNLMLWLLVFYNPQKEVQDSFALDFSSHLSISNEDFVGRKWFFQELEHAVNYSWFESPGVIILGNPGSGKSAVMSQLISSPSSSPFIHKNIIGYHVCKFDEARTRDGMRFVHTLAHQLAKNIPEYSRVIKNWTIQNELNTHCKNDPIGCFHTTILDPIKKLKRHRNTKKFILIDALDECMEKGYKSSPIVTIVKNKMIFSWNFTWIRLIISSRKKTHLIAQFPTFEKLAINSTDQRSLEDIRSYVEHVMLGNNRFKTEPWKKFGKGLIEQLYKNNEGNFLYFKTLLQHLNKNNVANLDFFPRTLDHLYGFLFRDRFEREDFERFAPLFEVVLASNSPPTMTKLEAILKIRKDTYDTRRVVKQASEYLIIGKDETVRFYHQSFANWLMNQTEDCGGLFIQKSRGHQYIADYLFNYFHKRNTTLSLQELSELSMHVLFGGKEERHLSKLESFNVSQIYDPISGKCILHILAKERNSTPIIEIFLKKFDSIDISTEFDGLTPLCYAAFYGNFENLKLFIENGADVNNVFDSKYYIILEIAKNGYTKIARLLINNGVDFNKESRWGKKPLQEAIENGHLDFVKLLVNKRVNANVSALYHAATKNHSDIVRFLLDIGIRDVCFAWKTDDIKSCQINKYFTPYHSTTNSYLCGTVMRAAVFKGHVNIVKLLLSYGKDTLECKDILGKTPLLLAAARNDTEMAKLLLNEGANVKAECDCFQLHEGIVNRNLREDDICSCGMTSIDLFARQQSWEMVRELVFRWKDSLNCQGLTSESFAGMQDRGSDFIVNFNAICAGKTLKLIMNKTALRHIVTCGSLETLKLLTSIATNTSVLQMVYEDGTTLLHLAAQWYAYPLTYKGFHFETQSSIEDFHDVVLNKSLFFLRNFNEYKNRLITVKLLTKFQNINKKDKYGKTALHYAAAGGFAGAVRHLVRQGSDWRAKDQNGDTPLELALNHSPLQPDFFLPCRMTSDGVFRSCSSTMFDETVRYLIMLQKSSIKKCNIDTKRLLHLLVEKSMPLSLYSLFKIGIDVNCGVELFKFQLNLGKKKRARN